MNLKFWGILAAAALFLYVLFTNDFRAVILLAVVYIVIYYVVFRLAQNDRLTPPKE